MKLSRKILLLSFCVVIAAGAQVFAQNPRQTPSPAPPSTPSPVESQDTEVVRSRLVNLPVTVMDKKGQHTVNNLTRGDFQIYEDKQLQTIKDFITERESIPVYVAVLMDTSGST